ncbi:MAG TPA: response regulator [Hyphomicrobiaceae bacterium]|nr:response regulator [Hyphomicrobiaceae bacterium]
MKNAVLGDREILVVEDEPLIAFEIALTLEEAGARVIGPVGSLRKALETIDRTSPHAAVLDVRLGREDVGPAAALLARRDIPFLFHTGHADASLLADWPGRPIIRKPAPPGMILNQLVKLLSPA